jgi:hypothetical protein
MWPGFLLLATVVDCRSSCVQPVSLPLLDSSGDPQFPRGTSPHPDVQVTGIPHAPGTYTGTHVESLDLKASPQEIGCRDAGLRVEA